MGSESPEFGAPPLKPGGPPPPKLAAAAGAISAAAMAAIATNFKKPRICASRAARSPSAGS
jgi:hypothetical protein